MNPDDLSKRLTNSVAEVTAQPDLPDVERRAGIKRRRHRTITGLAAAMLVAGAGGAGFGIGRSVSDGAGTLAAGAGDAPTATVAPPGDDGGTPPPTSPPPSADDAEVVLPEPPPIDESTASTAPASVGDVDETSDYYLDPYEQPMEQVYERTLSGGERVRLQVGQPFAEDFSFEGGPDDWRPAAFCYSNIQARVTIDSPTIVDVESVSWYEELFNGLSVSPFNVGWADGSPRRVVVVQTTPDATEATITWADGVSDTAPIVDGVAVLVVPGGRFYETTFVLDIASPAGVRSVEGPEIDYWNDPEYRAGCEPPPPALPEAGEQPDDPAAETAALTERFQLLWNLDIASEDKPSDLLDDDTAIDDVREQIAAGEFADAAAGAVQTIEELVFTSPTEAWFRYSIETSITDFFDRYGTATLVDGVWVFPRALVCQDAALAGGQCSPPAEPIYPPAWYERYGGPYAQECFVTEDGEEVCEGYGEAGATAVTVAAVPSD